MYVSFSFSLFFSSAVLLNVRSFSQRLEKDAKEVTIPCIHYFSKKVSLLTFFLSFPKSIRRRRRMQKRYMSSLLFVIYVFCYYHFANKRTLETGKKGTCQAEKAGSSGEE